MSEKKMEIAMSNMNDEFAVCEVNQGAAIRATTTDNTATLFNALNGQGKKISEFMGVPLTIVNIVVSSGNVAKNYEEKDDENAEKVSKPCVHFFTDDGTHISSISNGIARATRSLFEAGLTPSKESPIKIMFTTANSKRGTAHTFEMIEE